MRQQGIMIVGSVIMFALIFGNDFETGDLSAWKSIFPCDVSVIEPIEDMVLSVSDTCGLTIVMIPQGLPQNDVKVTLPPAEKMIGRKIVIEADVGILTLWPSAPGCGFRDNDLVMFNGIVVVSSTKEFIAVPAIGVTFAHWIQTAGSPMIADPLAPGCVF